MFFPDAHKGIARSMGWNPATTYRVAPTDIWISDDVYSTICEEIMALCLNLGTPYSRLRRKLSRQLYWDEQSDQLALSMEVRGTDHAPLRLAIPDGQWGFREANQVMQ